MGEPEENIVSPDGAEERAEEQPKRVIGRPFTKANARQMQLSSTAAKKRRKETRLKMLDALTTKLDLGQELVNAFHEHDADQMALIEKALRIVGLHYDQTDEARAQRLDVNAKTENKHDVAGKIEFVLPEKK